MQSVKLAGIKKFDIYDDRRPTMDNKFNVLIKIASVGVCGSDMHYYKHGKIGEQVVKYPFTIGHEASGYVEEIIGGTGELKVGQLVAIDPAISCGSCDQCRAGRHHTCREIKFMGAPGQLPGMMSEYVTVPAENVFKVPSSFTPEEAAFVEPLSIGAYAAVLADAKVTDTIGVFGVGPIGLSVLMSLSYKGFNKLFSWDKLDYRADLAGDFGESFPVESNSESVLADVYSKVEEGLDVVFDCCGEQEALDNAVKVLKPGGKLVIVGIPDSDRISFDIHTLRRNEIKIINVRRQNNSVAEAIKVMESFKEFSPKILTHTFNVTDTVKAYQIVNDYADNVIKATINF